jgi:phage tail-like protein
VAPIGAFLYGDTGGISAITVDPFTATALDYDKVFITYQYPVGSSAFNKIRLVRNQDGVSDTAEDGIILYDKDLPTDPRQQVTFVDASPIVYPSLSSVGKTGNTSVIDKYQGLIPGKYAYYSVWLFLTTDSRWYQAGTAYTVIASRHETLLSNQVNGVPGSRTRNTHEKFMDMLPRVFTSSNGGAVDAVDYDSVLSAFLSAFTYTLDESLTYIDFLAPDHLLTETPPSLLGVRSYGLGISSENRASTRFQKQLLRDAKELYRIKGTPLGLSGAIEDMTGYNTTTTPSPNLMLSVQDSTFVDWISYQDWLTKNSATITGAVTDGIYTTYTGLNNFVLGQQITVSGVSPTDFNFTTAIVVKRSRTDFTVKTGVDVSHTYSSGGKAMALDAATYSFWSTVGKCTMTAETTVVPATEALTIDTYGTAKIVTAEANAQVSIGNDKPITRAVPVDGGSIYTLSYYVKTISSTPTVTPTITWYDIKGAKIFSVAGSADSLSTSWSRKHVTATAPSDIEGTVTNISKSGSTVTITTTAAASYAVNQTIQLIINDAANTGVSGTYMVTATGTNTVQFTYSGSVVNGAVTSGRVSGLQNAIYAGISLKFSATNTYYLDMVQFAEDSAGTLAYHEARGVTLYMEPSKYNKLLNPSFETTSSWLADSATPTLVTASDTLPGPVVTGSGTKMLSISGSGNHTLTTSSGVASTILADQSYVFSVYARATTAVAIPLTVTLTASNGSTTVTNSKTYTTTGSILSATAAATTNTYRTTYPVKIGDIITVSGYTGTSAGYNIANVPVLATRVVPGTSDIDFDVASPVVISAAGGAATLTVSSARILTKDWHRFEVSLYIPATLTGTITLTPSVTFTGISGTDVLFDASQLENGFTATDYFDGSYVNDGAFWVGSSNASESVMYSNYSNKIVRLFNEIENYLPSGVPYTVTRLDGIATIGSGSTVPIVGITP